LGDEHYGLLLVRDLSPPRWKLKVGWGFRQHRSDEVNLRRHVGARVLEGRDGRLQVEIRRRERSLELRGWQSKRGALLGECLRDIPEDHVRRQ
jgi:hypothetical protein